MEKSEYRQTNFDPNDPKYMFFYTVFLEQTDPEAQVARCTEQSTLLIVGEKIKNACSENKLAGLVFYRAHDMTYNNRTVCEKISPVVWANASQAQHFTHKRWAVKSTALHISNLIPPCTGSHIHVILRLTYKQT